MTIGDLIKELERRAGLHGRDTEVQITWESVFRAIDSENIYFGRDRRLILDADNNSYKYAFAVRSELNADEAAERERLDATAVCSPLMAYDGRDPLD